MLSDRAVALARSAGDQAARLRAEALALFASNRLGRGVPATGRALAAVRDAESAGDDEVTAELRVELAWCACAAGSPEVAARILRSVLEQERIDPSLRAHALLALAASMPVREQDGARTEALDEAERLYDAGEGNRDTARMLRARVCAARAGHHRRLGEFAEATAVADAGLELLRELGDPAADSGEVRTRLVLERVQSLLELGHRPQAVEAAERVLAEPVRAAAAGPVGWLGLALATRVHLPNGDHSAALRVLGDTAAISERHKLDGLLAEALNTLSQVHERGSEFAEALRSLRGAYAADRRWRAAVHQARVRLLADYPARTECVHVPRQSRGAQSATPDLGSPDVPPPGPQPAHRVPDAVGEHQRPGGTRRRRAQYSEARAAEASGAEERSAGAERVVAGEGEGRSSIVMPVAAGEAQNPFPSAERVEAGFPSYGPVEFAGVDAQPPGESGVGKRRRGSSEAQSANSDGEGQGGRWFDESATADARGDGGRALEFQHAGAGSPEAPSPETRSEVHPSAAGPSEAPSAEAEARPAEAGSPDVRSVDARHDIQPPEAHLSDIQPAVDQVPEAESAGVQFPEFDFPEVSGAGDAGAPSVVEPDTAASEPELPKPRPESDEAADAARRLMESLTSRAAELREERRQREAARNSQTPDEPTVVFDSALLDGLLTSTHQVSGAVADLVDPEPAGERTDRSDWWPPELRDQPPGEADTLPDLPAASDPLLGWEAGSELDSAADPEPLGLPAPPVEADATTILPVIEPETRSSEERPAPRHGAPGPDSTEAPDHQRGEPTGSSAAAQAEEEIGGRRSRGRSLAEIQASLRLPEQPRSGRRRARRRADPDEPEPESEAAEAVARHRQPDQTAAATPPTPDPPQVELPDQDTQPNLPVPDPAPVTDPEVPEKVGLAELLTEALLAYETGRRGEVEAGTTRPGRHSEAHVSGITEPPRRPQRATSSTSDDRGPGAVARHRRPGFDAAATDPLF
ncbi:hypothetical protein ABT324_24070 [Saccharopolyspora sp. NPDC000359]|uniref:hypothetical protein n=1 Tax=Saccharopolyspora sp. NPDC000359 TaxID=3154251 RepID=UPI003324D751